MDKYLYKINKEERICSLEEIANEANLDIDYLREVVHEVHDDIDLACAIAFKEINKKQAISKLLDLYPTNYICSNNINELVSNEFDIKNNKRRLLNTLNYVYNENNRNDYVIFNKMTLNNLIVNTTDDINKQVMDGENLLLIKFLRESLYFEIPKYNVGKISMDIRKGDNTITITSEEAKEVIECLKNYKLPCNYNVLVTKDLVDDMNSYKRNNTTYYYTKRK